jgi:hypothetical protein
MKIKIFRRTFIFTYVLPKKYSMATQKSMELTFHYTVLCKHGQPCVFPNPSIRSISDYKYASTEKSSLTCSCPFNIEESVRFGST